MNIIIYYYREKGTIPPKTEDYRETPYVYKTMRIVSFKADEIHSTHYAPHLKCYCTVGLCLRNGVWSSEEIFVLEGMVVS